MGNFFFKFLTLLLVVTFLNSCSTVSEKLNIEELINKTEEFFFSDEDEPKEIASSEQSEIESMEENYEIDEQLQDFPDISEVPEEMPEFPEMDESFFEGETITSDSAIIDDTENNQVTSYEEADLDDEKTTISKETIILIANISSTIRLKVRNMLASSDPPTNPDGKKISFQNNNEKQEWDVDCYYG